MNNIVKISHHYLSFVLRFFPFVCVAKAIDKCWNFECACNIQYKVKISIKRNKYNLILNFIKF